MRIDWTRDEIILACDLVRRHGWKSLGDSLLDVRELSTILNQSALHPVGDRDEKFRNPAGVARKTADIATQHPDYGGKPTKGNKLDREVLAEFLENPSLMHSIAEEILASIRRGEHVPHSDGETDDEEFSAKEGRLLAARHYRRERSPKLRKKKVEDCRKKGIPITCTICSFDFKKTYGPRGFEYVEVHHVLPLHTSGEVVTKLSDLAMLCANCHRMIHRTKNWLTVDELRAIFEQNTPVPVTHP